ncbi:MAG: phosphoribosyltransferase [Chlamydiae bacterium]|nr:phosphoribosyltransferase [Chlamydiota bacterium]
MIFEDRKDAGQKLTTLLERHKSAKNTIVLGLARGGMVLALEISKKLNLPLDVLVVRKIGAPFSPEFAIGALVRGEVVLHNEVIRRYGISKDEIERIIEEKKREEDIKEKIYARYRKPIELEGKIVILVDDGLATGASMEAAVKYLKKVKVGKIIVAVPVASEEGRRNIQNMVDEFVEVFHPHDFMAVGQFYRSFEQVEDQMVCEILEESRKGKENL